MHIDRSTTWRHTHSRVVSLTNTVSICKYHQWRGCLTLRYSSAGGIDRWTDGQQKRKDANFWKSIRTVEKYPTVTSLHYRTSITTKPRKCLKQCKMAPLLRHTCLVPNSDYKLSQTQQWKNAKARMDVCFWYVFRLKMLLCHSCDSSSLFGDVYLFHWSSTLQSRPLRWATFVQRHHLGMYRIQNKKICKHMTCHMFTVFTLPLSLEAALLALHKLTKSS